MNPQTISATTSSGGATSAAIQDRSSIQHPNGVVHLEEYQDDRVQRTLDPDYRPALLQEAVDREWDFLRALDWDDVVVVDIGIGQARHALELASQCRLWWGVDISAEMIAASQKVLDKAGITTVSLVHCDAEQVLEIPDATVHRSMCLYFGAGNLRKDNFDVAHYDLQKDVLENPKFVAVVRDMYRSLALGGHLLLTVYKETPATRAMQKSFYEGTGQTIITTESDPFTATSEGFWSVRFTQEMMLHLLSLADVDPQQVTFHDLNEISWIVEVAKP